ncbi:hypothetical protein FOG18_07215 [Legionella israelensis]|uniref:aldo/keto reductase n=1 Tax=Legionella israelensis TaxID=454 RepID=UPI00117D2A0E|nr:aldo/keto reductase [Legionella israelensis]QDP72361.1 hypothetical protein FOG18_07215 [Legionella israelensis]
MIDRFLSNRRVCIIIQSRLSSRRLPAKALLPLAGYPMVVLCALRAANTGLPVLVATSDKKEDDIIEKLTCINGISCFRGELEDVLSRFTQAVIDYHNDDLVIRITADNVFPDGKFLNLLLDEFESECIDYLGTSSPDDGLPYGLSAEIFKIGALRKANLEANTSFDREHVTPFIRRNLICKQFKLSHIPTYWKSLRCTIDNFSDYVQMIHLFEQIKNPVQISWFELIDKLHELTCINEKTKVCNIEQATFSSENKFILGTAQLGLSYGIANKQGLLKEATAKKLIKKAISLGINTLDTARAYGLSEQRLGRSVAEVDAKNIQFISKLHPLDYLKDDASSEEVRSSVKASVYETCYHLKVSTLDVMLLHRWEHYYKWDGVVWSELVSLKAAGVINKLGVSVTTPDEAICALQDSTVEYIQCPVNMLDWRWRKKNFLVRVSTRPDVFFLARSVYLQGLLLMNSKKWPIFPHVDINKINTTMDSLVCKMKRLNRQDLCLAYVRGLNWINGLVIGVESEKQLEENIELFRKPPLSLEEISEVERSVPSLPETFLNPSSWKLGKEN